MDDLLVGNPRVWRAMGHPVRSQIRDHLTAHGPGTSTSVAAALGLNTGTVSYHLRVLGDVGLLAEVPERAHGKERWWRAVPIDLREPAHPGTDATTRAVSDERQLRHAHEDLALLRRLYHHGHDLEGLAGISRSTVTWTPAQLAGFINDYQQLLDRHATPHTEDTPGATKLALRLFAVPTEHTEE